MVVVERRKDPRRTCFAEVKVVGRDETYIHPTSNLSLGGVFLRTEFPLELGTTVVLEFSNVDTVTFIVVGHVAWRSEQAPPARRGIVPSTATDPGMGICFDHLGEIERACLEKLIEFSTTARHDPAPHTVENNGHPQNKSLKESA